MGRIFTPTAVLQYLIFVSTAGFFCVFVYLPKLESSLDCHRVPVVHSQAPDIPEREQKSPGVTLDARIALLVGVPGSGVSLLRVVLGSHPQLHCPEKTTFATDILEVFERSRAHPVESKRLAEAGVTQDVMRKAYGGFLLEVMTGGSQRGPLYCHTDNLLVSHVRLMASLLPNARFVHVVRDGRAAMNSYEHSSANFKGMKKVKRQMEIEWLHEWRVMTAVFEESCKAVEGERCLTVRYEDLVTQPTDTLKRVCSFLDIPFSSDMLHHHHFVGSEVPLHESNPRLRELLFPINTDSLDAWRRSHPLPAHQLQKLAVDPELPSHLGYDLLDTQPTVRDTDEVVRSYATLIADNPEMFDPGRFSRDGEKFLVRYG